MANTSTSLHPTHAHCMMDDFMPTSEPGTWKNGLHPCVALDGKIAYWAYLPFLPLGYIMSKNILQVLPFRSLFHCADG